MGAKKTLIMVVAAILMVALVAVALFDGRCSDRSDSVNEQYLLSFAAGLQSFSEDHPDGWAGEDPVQRYFEYKAYTSLGHLAECGMLALRDGWQFNGDDVELVAVYVYRETAYILYSDMSIRKDNASGNAIVGGISEGYSVWSNMDTIDD